MQIPPELIDDDHCVLCRRSWKEVIGLTTLQYTSEEDYSHTIQTAPKVRLCRDCGYEQGMQLVENGGTLPTHVGFLKTLPTHLSVSCRFCGTSNSTHRTLFSSERGVPVCINCFLDMLRMNYSILANTKFFTFIDINEHYYQNCERVREYARGRLQQISSLAAKLTSEPTLEGGEKTERETGEETIRDIPGRSHLYVVGGTDLDALKAANDGGDHAETEQPDPKTNTSSSSVLIGRETNTNNQVEIGDIERRSSLYVLGKPGMGKSTLLSNLITQDIKNGNSVFFLDPHGEAIRTVFRTCHRLSVNVQDRRVYLLYPADEEYSFGINPLFCKDLSSRTARNAAFNKAYNIFKRVWESDNQWGLWLSLILRNTLPVLIETQQTLAEMPLFLNNRDFRQYLLRQVRYNASALDFWKYEFKPEQAQPALVRVRALLGEDDYVRDIVGQQITTIDFPRLTTDIKGSFLFLRLPTNLNDETARFIGTIVTTELLHAIRARTGEDVKYNYCLYVDEFQHFATDQFAEFINEGRKFGCATTIAHQERLGQFGENQKVLGATLACANKVLFQVTVKDARELAPEFAEKPVALQTRLVPEMVICKEPLWDLVQRGHSNPRVMELFRYHFLWHFENLTESKNEAEKHHLIRSGYFDEAMMFRDHASLSGIDEKRENIHSSSARGWGIKVSHAALDRTEALLQQAMQAHGLAQDTLIELRLLSAQLRNGRKDIYNTENFLIALMEGRVTAKAGQEAFANFLIDTVGCHHWYPPWPICKLYIEAMYGDPKKPKSLLHTSEHDILLFATKYFLKDVADVYLPQRLKYFYKLQSNSYRMIEGKEIPLPAEEVEERVNRDMSETRKQLPSGYIALWGGKPEKIYLPEVPLGICDEAKLLAIRMACYEAISASRSEFGRAWSSSKFFNRIDELIEFCQLLSQPQNHIQVPSGQYVEKPVQIASTQEMSNQALQTLTELPRFTAYAKTISEERGEQTIWKGRIKTLPNPEATNEPGIEEQIIEQTRHAFSKSRSAIEQEIVNRRTTWRKTEPPPSPEGQPSRAPEKVQQEPPSPWTEC